MAGDGVPEIDAAISAPLRRKGPEPYDRRRFLQVPSSTLTNGIGGAYEYRRGGYSDDINAAWFLQVGRDVDFADVCEVPGRRVS